MWLYLADILRITANKVAAVGMPVWLVTVVNILEQRMAIDSPTRNNISCTSPRFFLPCMSAQDGRVAGLQRWCCFPGQKRAILGPTVK